MRAIKEYLTEKYKVTNFDVVLHIRKVDEGSLDTEGDIFIFPYGVIVTWGLTRESELEFSKTLLPFLGEHLGAIDDDYFSIIELLKDDQCIKKYVEETNGYLIVE